METSSGGDDQREGSLTGMVIDRYRLGEVIGEGGMGVVYRAEQLEPVRRTVALKLIKLGMDTREVIARFETERQALALMDQRQFGSETDRVGPLRRHGGIPQSVSGD